MRDSVNRKLYEPIDKDEFLDGASGFCITTYESGVVCTPPIDESIFLSEDPFTGCRREDGTKCETCEHYVGDPHRAYESGPCLMHENMHGYAFTRAKEPACANYIERDTSAVNEILSKMLGTIGASIALDEPCHKIDYDRFYDDIESLRKRGMR